MSSTRALSQLLHDSSDLDPEVTDEMRGRSEEIDRCLSRERLRVILLGEPKARRELLDTLLGSEVFGPGRESTGTLTLLRAAQGIDYRATTKNEMIEEFATRIPDRMGTFAAALARAERELEGAAETVRGLTDQIDSANAELARKQETFDEQPPQAAIRPIAWSEVDAPLYVPPPRVPPPPPAPSFFARLWLWILALFGTKRELPAPPPSSARSSAPVPALRVVLPLAGEIVRLREAVSVLEIDIDHARARRDQAKARLAQLSTDCAHYLEERKTAFLADVRSLVDGAARGAEVTELVIEFPSELLPPGFELVEAPAMTSKNSADRERGRALLRDADGCILVTDANGDTTSAVSAILQEIHPVTPRVVRGLSAVPELPRLFERIRNERPLIVGARAIALVRPCIAKAAANGARAEKSSRERVAALEKQRILDPKEFRARSMSRIAKAIEDGAADVVKSGVERLHVRIGDIKVEWRAGIDACTSRSAVDACVKKINESASRRLASVVEEVSDVVVSEMQKASDTMQVWVLEELHARYEVARRLSISDPAPVVSDVLAEDLASLRGAPLGGALDKFESQRVGMGLGGAAVGAALGTLIVPGIGTAIGAFIGVFAGFLKGVDSLKKDCTGRLDAVLEDSEREVKTQVESRTKSFADAIRASLEEAFDTAMQRFEQSIARLMTLERKVLDAENAKLARLKELQSTLIAHEGRFADLAKLAAKAAKASATPAVSPAGRT